MREGTSAEPGGPRQETRVNDRLPLLVLFVIALFVVGLFIAQPVMLLSIPVMALLGFLLLSLRPPHTDVEFSRTLERARVVEGETCRVTMRVRNLRPRAIAALQLRDLVPSQLDQDSTQNGFTFALGGGETRELWYEVRPRTFGNYTLGPVILSAEDATGLLESRAVIESRSALVATPKSAGRLKSFAIRPRRTRSQPGGIPARRTGAGMDYYNTRQFLAGESVRRINWRATARLTDEHSFMVNDYVAELGADVMIIADARNTHPLSVGPDPTFAYTVRASLSIADRLLRDKNRVGLMAISSWMEQLAPAIGSRQFNRIAVTLAKMQPGVSFVIRSVPSTLHNFYPRVSQVVLVSPLSDDNVFRTAAELARDAAHDTMVISPNPLDFVSRALRRRFDPRELALAKRLAQLERKTKISELRTAGVPVVDWSASDPLDRVLDVNSERMHVNVLAGARRR